MEEELDRDSFSDIETQVWAHSFSIMYEKGFQKALVAEVQSQRTNQAILATTGLKANPVIDAWEIIEKKYKEICFEARKYADNVIVNYRRTLSG